MKTSKLTLVAGVRQAITISDTASTPYTLYLYNDTHGNHLCAFGDETVTTSNGIHLYGGEFREIQIGANETLYAIADETIDLRVLATCTD